MNVHKLNITTAQHGAGWSAVTSHAGQLPPRGQDRLAAQPTEAEAIAASVAHLFTSEAKDTAAEQAATPLDERRSQHMYAVGSRAA